MSYQSFVYSMPTKIVFGVDTSKQTGTYLAEFNPRKVLIVTYQNATFPVLSEIRAQLEAMDIAYELYDQCTANPTAEQIDAGALFSRSHKCDIILGVGGGSVIDSAKGIALMSTNSDVSGVWEYISGEKQPKNPALPILLVVTIASTGSESNESFVITDKDVEQKMIYNHPSVRPRISICDAALSVSLPPKQTALGAADVLSHLLEQYLHCDTAVETSDNMIFGVMQSVVKWAPVAYAQPQNMDARNNLLWCSILAMSRVFGVGHQENWTSHILEHAVSAKYNIAHAAGMTSILPTYLDWLKPRDITGKLNKVAELFESENPRTGMERFFSSMGLPINLKEATGLVPDAATIKDLACNAIPWGAMQAGGYGEFTQEDGEAVLAAAWGR